MEPRCAGDEKDNFVLSAWCTTTKAWHDLPSKYESARGAIDAAKERGIYRVAFMCRGERVKIDTFAIVGDD